MNPHFLQEQHLEQQQKRLIASLLSAIEKLKWLWETKGSQKRYQHLHSSIQFLIQQLDLLILHRRYIQCIIGRENYTIAILNATIEVWKGLLNPFFHELEPQPLQVFVQNDTPFRRRNAVRRSRW